MKTAISLPDEVFTDADTLAKRLKVTRSQLYAKALGEYISRHAPDAVTDALNQVCDDLGANQDGEFAGAVSRRTLEQTQW